MSKLIDIADGRQNKRVGNRRRMLLAGLKLIERGHYRFSAKDITDKVGMHRRSFFENFENIEGFVDELLSEHEGSVRAAVEKDVRENGKSLARIVLLGH